MKKIALFLAITPLLLLADLKTDTYKLYQAQKYDKVCQMSEETLHQNRTDEELISIYAFSCLNVDRLDQLALPIVSLKSSAESRANAAYFSVILMQKKLLMHALSDQYDLKAIRLPTTEYVLSTVFDLYTHDTGSKQKRRYNYVDPKDPTKAYRLYVTKSGPSPKMVIEEYQNKQMTQRHIYW